MIPPIARPPLNRIDQIHPEAPALAGYGAYPIGVKTLHLTNPDQIDVLGSGSGLRRYDRPLTVEIWYPAEAGRGPVATSYTTLLRDGHRLVTLHGRACRDAARDVGDFPLVILSHGYPGNRMLMSHFGETLASRGYVVASIDHTDSTYADKGPLASTLVNRPLDTAFVKSALGDLADTTRFAIIGYSMGGYGALVSGGAGVAKAALSMEGAPPLGLWDRHRAPVVDPDLRAIIPIGPWGRHRGLWDAQGLRGLSVPMLMMAGSADEISGYANGMRLIFEEATGVERQLLTFEGAGHNAAAPYPAPIEAFEPSAYLDFLPAEHYADPVWDTVLMNGIAQAHALVFLDRYLKGVAHDTAPGLNRGLRLEWCQSV